MNRLAKFFLNGLLILVPLAATLYVAYLIFVKIDSLLPTRIPGLGFLLTLVLITVVGFLASNLFIKGILDFLESMFTRLPLVKLLYSSIKDLIGAFVGEKKKFDRPVAVTLFPGSSAKALGFITRESLEFLGLREQVAVYLPQSYNFGGNLVVFPRNQVEPLPVESSEMMVFIMSGGVAGGEPGR